MERRKGFEPRRPLSAARQGQRLYERLSPRLPGRLAPGGSILLRDRRGGPGGALGRAPSGAGFEAADPAGPCGPRAGFEGLMDKFVIEGGERLRGTVKVSGSKNAVLPVLAATTPRRRAPTAYDNVPRLRDVDSMVKLLSFIGAKCERGGRHTLIGRYDGRGELYGPLRDGEGDAGLRPRPRRPRGQAQAGRRLLSRRLRHRRAAHRPAPEGAFPARMRREASTRATST